MRGARRELRGIPGTPPDLRQAIGGCAFAPRCDYAFDSCATVLPQRSGQAACHLHDPELCPGGPPPELSGERPTLRETKGVR
jgi:peptide/nickel transport system ATP-binding protein